MYGCRRSFLLRLCFSDLFAYLIRYKINDTIITLPIVRVYMRVSLIQYEEDFKKRINARNNRLDSDIDDDHDKVQIVYDEYYKSDEHKQIWNVVHQYLR